MAIHYLERHEIDSTKWDTCIASNPHTENLFAYSGYLDIACDAWSALVLGDYVSIMPLPWRQKLGIYYIYPPFFLPSLGIFGKEIENEYFTSWVNAIPQKFQWIDSILHEHHHDIHEAFTGFMHKTYLLDCRLSYPEIKKGYHQNHKRNCQKASEEGLTIVHNFTPEEAINLFYDNQAKIFKAGYKENDYKRLVKIINVLHKKQQLECWGVCDANGTLCAAAFFPFLHGKYYFLFSGRNADSTQNRAMFLLIDTFIQQHANQACILDFNGSDNLHIAKFYAGFGAIEKSLYQMQIARLHPLFQWAFNLYRKVR